MTELNMDTFKGITIMLLTIIAYMIIDSILNIRLITYALCAASGALVILFCKNISREDLNTFRATMVLGIAFFLLGNYVLFTNLNNATYDTTLIYIVSLGFFLTAIGMIIMFSSIPIIIYKDIIDRRKLITKQ